MSASEGLAWVGLGSNVDGPAANVRAAFEALEGIERTRCWARSSLYASTPMGPPDQPLYVNAVAGLATELTPHELLRALHAIERQAGRERDGVRWGPRRLDLDLLALDARTVADDELTLPHPGAGQRAFVLLPWAEVAPDARIPGLGRVGDLVPAGGDDVWLYRGGEA
jgi:2-amino-4-hydroxy-6-hydroxymethyldihydropteridine diphosphokinase